MKREASEGEDPAAHEAHEIEGLTSWGARTGHGSFLTIEFGSELTSEGDHSVWHLWLYGCDWEIRVGETVTCDSAEERARLVALVPILNRRVVTACSFSPAKSSIRFTDGVALEIRSNPEIGMDQWMLFMPADRVLTLDENLDFILEVEREA